MNPLKKIDHYLLTNHPVVWRTKVHYFVLFSLAFLSVTVFGMGYFSIKYFGAIDLEFVSTLIWGLNVFAILLWLIPQTRNKIKHYHFWDEVLTFSIYVICTALLIGNLMLFKITVTQTTAQLVSVEQVDIDDKTIHNRHGNAADNYGNLQPYKKYYPPYDVVVELAERYRLNTSFTEAEIPVKIDKILGRKIRIRSCQFRVGMRRGTLGRRMINIDNRLVFIFLSISVTLLFLISHTHLLTVLGITAIYFTLLMLTPIIWSPMAMVPIVPIVLYVLLLGFAVHGEGKTNHFATLLIIPYTSIFYLGFTMTLTGWHNIFFDTLIYIVLFFALVVTVLSGAYFIKKHFEPST